MSWRRLALTPLSSLTWGCCGGEGGPAEPGEGVWYIDRITIVDLD